MYDWVDHVSFLHVLYPILGRPDWSISLLSISFICLNRFSGKACEGNDAFAANR
jgi:hypothetical protein